MLARREKELQLVLMRGGKSFSTLASLLVRFSLRAKSTSAILSPLLPLELLPIIVCAPEDNVGTCPSECALRLRRVGGVGGALLGSECASAGSSSERGRRAAGEPSTGLLPELP